MSTHHGVGAMRLGAILSCLGAVAVALYSRRPEAATVLLAGATTLVIAASSLTERGIRDEREQAKASAVANEHRGAPEK